MKLYASISNTRGKTASKGDNEQLHIEMKRGNEYIAHIYLTEYALIFERLGKRDVIHLGESKGKKKKDE